MSKVGNYKIPFDTNGNQLHYAGSIGGHVQWRENVKFDACIAFDGMRSGYSAKNIQVHDVSTGVKYTMFVKDALDVLQHGTVHRGTCEGTWFGIKRGQNYGIRLMT